MNNIIIDKVFDDLEIEHINKILSDNEENINLDEPQLGRTRYDIPKNLLGKNLIDKLESLAKQFNPNLRFGGCYYSEYNLKYGTPELSIHTDQTAAVFTIDYQLDANINWDVYVEGVAFSLKNNQAVTINVNSEAHWRPRRVFSEGEYVKMIYFHFFDISIKKPKILTREEMIPMQQKWMHLWDFKKENN